MSIVQFLRIFWARRLLILATTIACVIGAYIVTLILPPRWEATSRVMLNTLKPDPITGQVVGGQNLRGYASTQVQLITDYSVAGQVADQLGWTSDPNLLAAYERRPSSDKRDFRRWIAQIVIDNTKAGLVEGSNILQITYTATNPRDAKLVADALRKAYIDSSLDFRRSDAQRDAAWFTTQASTAEAGLVQAEAVKTQFERDNGIVMANDKMDIDSARLQALAMGGATGGGGGYAPTPGPTPASIQMAEIDAAIVEASKTLGPNHPEIQNLKARRKTLSSIAAQEQSAQRATIASIKAAASGTSGAQQQAVEAQKAKVVAQGAKIGKLGQLQLDVDLRRAEYNHISERLAQSREQAAVADPGFTPLGNAVVPKSAVFPNYVLIVPGSIVLGFALGILVSLLLELFARRIRGVEDLQNLIDAPLIGVIAAPAKVKTQGKARFGGLGKPGWKIRPPAWPTRRKMARA